MIKVTLKNYLTDHSTIDYFGNIDDKVRVQKGFFSEKIYEINQFINSRWLNVEIDIPKVEKLLETQNRYVSLQINEITNNLESEIIIEIDKNEEE